MYVIYSVDAAISSSWKSFGTTIAVFWLNKYMIMQFFTCIP